MNPRRRHRRHRRRQMRTPRALPPPAPPPVTPAPPRPAGEVAVQNWLEDSGLMEMDGLLSALVVVAPDLTRLSQLSDEKLLDALKPLKLRSLKIRKIHAAIIVLRQEREAFVRSTIGSTTSPSTDDGSTPGSHHGHYSHQNYSDRPGEVYVRGRGGSERRDSGECSEDGEASEISPTAAAARLCRAPAPAPWRAQPRRLRPLPPPN